MNDNQENIDINELSYEVMKKMGRKCSSYDMNDVSSFYDNKIVMVTGGAGSIGSSIVQLLIQLPIKKIYVYDKSEYGIYLLNEKYKNLSKLHCILGNILDYKKLNYNIKKIIKPDIIFHVAAYKHVPIMEEFPEEAILNNTIGSYNVARIALESCVEAFILISTDKAVYPSSIMGASKRLAEKMVLSFNELAMKRKNYPVFSVVRFGNVLGSSGSVLPTFLRQLQEERVIYVTHHRMRRFFMLIEEASHLVIRTAVLQKKGIYILKMGESIKIVDLAKNLIIILADRLSISQKVDIKYTQIRGGEKIDESLSYTDEFAITKYSEIVEACEDELSIISIEECEKIVRNLKRISTNQNKEKIRKRIKELLPEYRPEI